ncbi:ABC transporter permease [Aeromicrobium sp. Leaf350]|uniref:ABC transporter permease n=1 Tax=Aeromicrobium sp. Leaf350 TaxID=2876565 RepID=UPI001E64DD88|nr:ABC transporter permease subunit [Aeromicrobium sp. Leaf350]
MTPTIPSVRSRLSASFVAFVLGFALANLAIFAVPPPDQVLGVVVAALLMATAAWGVLVADSPRPISVWAVLGAEAFAVFTLVPLLWLVTLATGDGGTPTSLWPQAWGGGGFRSLADDGAVRDAAALSVCAAGLATLVAALPSLGLAALIVRTRWLPRRLVRTIAIASTLLPGVALAVGGGDLVLGLGGPFEGSALLRVALVQLAIAVPLTTWVFTAALGAVPWSVVDSARVDGAGPFGIAVRVLVPTVGPALVVGMALTVVVTAQDLALAASVTGPQSTTLPVLLLDRAQDPSSVALVAATGICWALPVALLALVVPRTITRLLGGSYR